jgi:cell filamentation protein
LNVKDGAALNIAEREITAVKIAYLKVNPLKGKFDLKHLQAIHRHIFYDIYEWAGELRTVNIAKGNMFCKCQFITTYADSLFQQLKKERFLTQTPPETIYDRLTFYFSEINVLHPFREGNGRAQRVFIEYLASAAGYHIDFSNVSNQEMIVASVDAFDKEYGKLTEMLKRITSPIEKKIKVAQ